jgi:hypothetical protein
MIRLSQGEAPCATHAIAVADVNAATPQVVTSTTPGVWHRAGQASLTQH